MTLLVPLAAVVVLILGYFLRHILGGMLGLYRVVPVNEAHIRILQHTKSVFSARVGKSAYWVVPFITKLHKLPLCNLAIPVNDIKLNDKVLDIHRDVMLAKFAALSQAIKEADIKWIMSGANAQKFFGLNLDAEGGANLQQFFQESGLDLDRLKALLKEKK